MIDEKELERRHKLCSRGYWEIPDGLDTSNFDFNWRPDPIEAPYIHQFGTQHQKTGGPRFIIPESEGVKYQTCQRAIKLPDPDSRCWRPLLPNASIDFSWHPDETEPPFIYVFGNQWYGVELMPTYQYRVKGATEKKYMYEVQAKLVADKSKWVIPENITDDFDYSWVPHPYEPPMDWQFGTQYQNTGGPRYISENSIGVKFCDSQRATKINGGDDRAWRPLISNIEFDYNWHPDDNEPPFIYVFGNQHYSAELMPTVLYRVKGATEKKYINDVKATLLPNIDKFEKLIDDDIDFDYSWVPHPFDPPMNYVFGNQWYDSKTMPTLKYKCEENDVIKYVDDVKATIKPDIRKFRKLEDVDDFDYSWRPNPLDPPYNHIFGSQYFVPSDMPTIVYRVKGAMINKPETILTPKLTSLPVVEYEDSIYDAVVNHQFTNKYIHLRPKYSQTKLDLDSIFTSTDHKIHILNGTEAIVHNDVKNYLYDKITDYPNIQYHMAGVNPRLLDIVFISNGESCADENLDHLLSLNLPNRIVHIKGVNGRVKSQHAAAKASNTPWYFLVNAKLKVNKDFDFSWQPNYLKSRRHYIFRATNPVNGLEYGHMAIVANNKILTLNTKVRGLDFTLDSPSEVVDINCGIAMFNSSAWDAWRTSFRECIKLCNASDNESKHRLEVWQTGSGPHCEDSIRGAKDAIEYYNSVNGEFTKLMLSYDWNWLREHYNVCMVTS